MRPRSKCPKRPPVMPRPIRTSMMYVWRPDIEISMTHWRSDIETLMTYQDLILIPRTNSSRRPPPSLDRPIRIWLSYQHLMLGPRWGIKTWSLDLDEESGPKIDTSKEQFAASTTFGSCPIRISLSYQYLNLGPRWSIKASMRYQDLISIPRTKCPQRPPCFRLSEQDLDEVSRSHIRT
jgi:hypothetical protein